MCSAMPRRTPRPTLLRGHPNAGGMAGSRPTQRRVQKRAAHAGAASSNARAARRPVTAGRPEGRRRRHHRLRRPRPSLSIVTRTRQCGACAPPPNHSPAGESPWWWHRPHRQAACGCGQPQRGAGMMLLCWAALSVSFSVKGPRDVRQSRHITTRQRGEARPKRRRGGEKRQAAAKQHGTERRAVAPLSGRHKNPPQRTSYAQRACGGPTNRARSQPLTLPFPFPPPSLTP